MSRSKFSKKLIEFHGSKDLIWARGLDYTCGIDGFTESKNSHHPHYHSLIYIKKKLSTQEFTELKFLMLTTWRKAIKKIVGRDTFDGALDIQQVKEVGKCAQYFNKVSMEITSNFNKDGAGWSISKMMMAYASEENEEKKFILKKKIKQFEKGTKNLRSMTFSAGFKDLAKQLEEETEEEVNINENRKVEFTLRQDLFKLIQKKNDLMRVYQMVDYATTGDKAAEPALTTLKILADKYSIENDHYDDDEMEQDYLGFIYTLNLWEKFRDTPDLYLKNFCDELHYPT